MIRRALSALGALSALACGPAFTAEELEGLEEPAPVAEEGDVQPAPAVPVVADPGRLPPRLEATVARPAAAPEAPPAASAPPVVPAPEAPVPAEPAPEPELPAEVPVDPPAPALECTPGAQDCLGDVTYRRCSAAGVWEGFTCQAGTQCRVGQAACS